MIIESWHQLEVANFGKKSKEAAQIEALMPKRVKKRRKLEEEDDAFEEFYDYIFPDDQAQSKNIKILQNAQKWKEGA